MKDNDFHHAKNETERETFTLKIERWINLHQILAVQVIILISWGGYFSQPFFESVVFMDGVAYGNAVSSAFEINLSSEQNNNRNIGSGWQ